MYIKKLFVTNFGGMASFETPLYPGVNIIVGETGAGKTSVLKAAATALSPIIQAATGELFHGRPIEPWEVRYGNSGRVSEKPLRISECLQCRSGVREERRGTEGDQNFEFCRGVVLGGWANVGGEEKTVGEGAAHRVLR